MANICENTLYAYSENKDNIEYIKKFLVENFNADVDADDESLDAYFDSKWTFPEEPMYLMVSELPDREDKTLYIRCLSVEYGCLYHAIHVYESNVWESV